MICPGIALQPKDPPLRCTDFTHAILRTPGRSVVDGLRAVAGADPSYEGVLAEHRAYADALEAAGVALHILDPLDAFPDSVFVEDPALVFGEGAILLNPGAPSRNGETALIRPTLAERFETVLRVERGYADGGDVMVTPDAVLIGLSARTDPTGAQSLAEALRRLGKAPHIVAPPRGALHLKTIASLIDEETILTTREGEESGLFERYRQIVLDPGEEPAANALRINETLLLPAGFPRIAERLEALHYRLALVDTTHVSRIDAGLTCMSLRWRERINP